jgi:hypothetical protein
MESGGGADASVGPRGGRLRARFRQQLSPTLQLEAHYGRLSAFQMTRAFEREGSRTMITIRKTWQIQSPSRGGEIRGRTIDEMGQPVPGALVRLGPYSAITDAAGEYEFARVPFTPCHPLDAGGHHAVTEACSGDLIGSATAFPGRTRSLRGFASIRVSRFPPQLSDNPSWPAVPTPRRSGPKRRARAKTWIHRWSGTGGRGIPCGRMVDATREGAAVIVRLVGDHVQLITQPDHARLARTVMEYCVALAGRHRRNSILRAIGDHDNGWDVPDAAPTVDPTTGNIVDFVSAPLAVRQAVWPDSVARLADDPWAAALVAHHALTVYERFRSEPAWEPFFAGMEAARDAMVGAGGGRLDDLCADYPFVRLGDLISLAFCTGATAAQQFGGWTVQLSGTRVVVTPDPFGGLTIPVEITAREVRHRRFASDRDLRDALSDARARTLRGEVAGSARAAG